MTWMNTVVVLGGETQILDSSPSSTKQCALNSVTETNRVRLVLFGMQNRTFSRYLAAR
jgi:hypothetical protein